MMQRHRKSHRPLEILERVRDLDRKALGESPEAMRFLEAHGIADRRVWDRFELGYADGRLRELLPDSGPEVAALRAAGILTPDGQEPLRGSIVVPLPDPSGKLDLLAGIPIDGSDLRLAGGAVGGVWNWSALASSPEVLLAPDLLEALRWFAEGKTHVVAIVPPDHWTRPVERILRDHRPHRVIAQEVGPEVLAGLAACGIDVGRPGSPKPLLRVDVTSDGFDLVLGLRRYEVRGIDHRDRRLRALIRALPKDRTCLGPVRQHIDHLDLYQARARAFFAQEAALALDTEVAQIQEDLTHVVAAAEAWSPPAPSAPPPMTDAEREEALAFLRDPGLLARVLEDLDRLGLVGERTNKLAAYLVATSRKMAEPLSLLVMSRPAAGKSTLAEAIARLMPPEEVLRITFLTGKALYYKAPESLRHKLVVIEEESGVAEAAYPLRAILTAGRLALERAGRAGRREVEGPISTILTTTRRRVDEELASRFLSVGIDESADQTRAILEIQRKRETGQAGGDREAVERRHRNAQRLLQNVRIVNPWAPRLAFSDRRVGARREHAKYLALIRAVAFLHQFQRPAQEGAIEVARQDLEVAHELAHEILGESLEDLTRPARRLLAEIGQWRPGKFTRRAAGDRLSWSYTHVAECLAELERHELVLRNRRPGGKLLEYELLWDGKGLQGGKVLLGLADIHTLFAQEEKRPQASPEEPK